MKRALILVDIQNDFLPDGALAVPNGDEVIVVANEVQPHFDLIVATQDWHPPQHQSFASNHEGAQVGEIVDLHGLEQVLWPDHCVQNTEGAELAADLDTADIDNVFRKGTDPKVDSYSGFYDNGHRRSTGLAKYLEAEGVDEVYIMGLATDYCVKFTALDAAEHGFETYVIEDGCRGVELNEGDCERALSEMREAGVEIVQSDEVTNG